MVLPEGNVSGEPIHVVRQGWQEKAWAARFVLTWMRLIRAGVVRAKRRRSKEYLERQVEREKRLFLLARIGNRTLAGQLRGLRSTCSKAVPPMLLAPLCTLSLRCAIWSRTGHAARAAWGVSARGRALNLARAPPHLCAHVISRCSAGEAHNYLNPHWRAE